MPSKPNYEFPSKLYENLSKQTFRNLSTSSNPIYKQAAIDWNRFINGVNETQRIKLRDHPSFKSYHDKVLKAVTVDKKYKAIRIALIIGNSILNKQ